MQIYMNQDIQSDLSPWLNKMSLYMAKMVLPAQRHLVYPTPIGNMHREYVSYLKQGYLRATPSNVIEQKPFPMITWDKQTYELASKISNKTGISKVIVLYFFTALYDLSRQGKISMKKWDPIGVQISTQLQQQVDKPWWLSVQQGVSGTAKLIPLLLISGSLLGLLYLTRKG